MYFLMKITIIYVSGSIKSTNFMLLDKMIIQDFLHLRFLLALVAKFHASSSYNIMHKHNNLGYYSANTHFL